MDAMNVFDIVAIHILEDITFCQSYHQHVKYKNKIPLNNKNLSLTKGIK